MILLATYSCNDVLDVPSQSDEDIVLELWNHIDRNYCFFELKGINWDSIKTASLARLNVSTSESDLFEICGDMVLALEDGHAFLRNGQTNIVYDFKEGYDVHFDPIIVEKKYLNSSFQREGIYTYGMINDSIGYVYLYGFQNRELFENIKGYFKQRNPQKLIIDVRNNGGGDSALSLEIVEYLIDEETKVGYISVKNGEERDDFTEVANVVATLSSNNYPVKTNILINRGSYSASSYLAGMVKYIDNINVIGQITGGGGGGGQSFELPNGWVVRIPHHYFLDAKMNHIELGVEPDVEIENTELDIMNQRDLMLEMAIEY